MNKAIQISEGVAKRMKATAHHYDHADRVRNWVLKIAQNESLNDESSLVLELAALWHDVGLDYVSDRGKHAIVSAQMFTEKFSSHPGISKEIIKEVGFLVEHHDKFSVLNNSKLSDNDIYLYKLLRILIDADTLELLGEVGYKRGLEATKEKGWPMFDRTNPLGLTYGYSAADFTNRMQRQKSGEIKGFIEESFVGQLNFQISCADLLYTSLAKSVGEDGKNYLKKKIKEIVKIT